MERKADAAPGADRGDSSAASYVDSVRSSHGSKASNEGEDDEARHEQHRAEHHQRQFADCQIIGPANGVNSVLRSGSVQRRSWRE
jgi:hypothetical protein